LGPDENPNGKNFLTMDLPDHQIIYQTGFEFGKESAIPFLQNPDSALAFCIQFSSII